VKEILEVLRPKPGEIVVDATLGFGGHAEELARAVGPGGRLYGIDADPIELPKTEARLRALGFSAETLMVRRMNFAGLPKLLGAEKIDAVDVILADLGVSSMQIDNPLRGFTFKAEGPLDLRMNPERGQPASALLERITESELTDLLTANSDEPNAALIAVAICQTRSISTTTRLAAVIRGALARTRRPAEEIDTSIRRVFQALRIAVNDEFSALETFLRHLPQCLKPEGRVAILTFHSGEDRRVKKAFQAGCRERIYSSASSEVIRPNAEEIRSNPRAASAKLRWAIKAF
jgi:16S rRNA (cytosine1402-N4)-methyltransferase